MGWLAHVQMALGIADDGYVHLGNGNVIMPEDLAKGLAESRWVELESITVDGQRVAWTQHLDEGLAMVISEISREATGKTVFEQFLGPKVLNRLSTSKDRKTLDL